MANESKGTFVFQIWSGNDGILVPEGPYLEICQINSALLESRTWAEFQRKLPASEFESLQHWCSQGGEQVYRDEDGSLLFLDPSEEESFWRDLGEDYVINATESFSLKQVPGAQDGDYPPWLRWAQPEQLPDTIFDRFGRIVSSTVSGDWAQFSVDALSDIAEALYAQGYWLKVNRSYDTKDYTGSLAIFRVRSDISPREVIAKDFPTADGALPISGGWGYTREDACIINKDDPLVDPTSPFNGVAIEYAFVEKRIYEELIVFRPSGDKFSGIQWNLLNQELAVIDGKPYDKLVFEIEAFPDSDWEKLKAEWEGPDGYGSSDFDEGSHNRVRESKKVKLQREFWFDISSFYSVS